MSSALANINPTTGEMTQVPADDPLMKAVNKVYDASSREEREAFHKFTCNNDMSEANMAVVRPLMSRIQEAVKKLPC